MRHGIYSGYTYHRCRCDLCKRAMARYSAQVRKAKIMGIWVGPQPIEPTARHIDELLERGTTQRAIADATGLDVRTIRDIRLRKQGTVSARTARLIRAVTPSQTETYVLVDRTVMVRQITAMCALGYSKRWIAQQAGVRIDVLRPKPGKTRREHADAVAAVAARVGDTPGPSAKVRTWSANKGWLPPAAYDNQWRLPTDRPVERIETGADDDYTFEERYQMLHDRGLTTEDIAGRLRLSFEDAQRLRWKVEQRRIRGGLKRVAS